MNKTQSESVVALAELDHKIVHGMKLTQSESILSALKRGDRLTPQGALIRFGCFRLGARIYDLKKDGYAIESRLVRYGDSRVAEYSMRQVRAQ